MSHVGAHTEAVPLSSVTRQVLKRRYRPGLRPAGAFSGARAPQRNASDVWMGGQIGLFDADPLTERQLYRRSRGICFVGDRHHQRFGVVALRAFESPCIKTRSFRLDDPQSHCITAFEATRTLDNVREHCVSPQFAYPPIGKYIIGRALRNSRVRKMTDVWKSSERLRGNRERVLSEHEICAMLAARRNRIARPGF